MEALSEDRSAQVPSPQPPPARGGGEPAHSDLPLPLREGVGGRGPRALCRLDDLVDGSAKGFPPPPGGFTGLFAVRGTPLEWTADRFLSHDGSLIICATHGAEFRIADGECLRGPCFGERLEPVMIQIKDGTIFVPEDAGL